MPQNNSDQAASSHVVPDLPPDLHALDYLAYLFRRKWLVIGCVLLGAAGFLGASYIMPYTYTAQARLLPPGRMASAGLLNSLNASGALRILKEIENPSVDLIQNFIESRTMGEIVARDSTIRAFYKQNSSAEPLDAVMQAIVVQPSFAHVDVIAMVSTGWFSSPDAK